MNVGTQAAQLLAMASAMDNVIGPMSMIQPKIKSSGNKYAGHKPYSGKKETERRQMRLARNK